MLGAIIKAIIAAVIKAWREEAREKRIAADFREATAENDRLIALAEARAVDDATRERMQNADLGSRPDIVDVLGRLRDRRADAK